ncbi:hypothetical protein CSUI_008013, partial [Cystoisospora suis]
MQHCLGIPHVFSCVLSSGLLRRPCPCSRAVHDGEEILVTVLWMRKPRSLQQAHVWLLPTHAAFSFPFQVDIPLGVRSWCKFPSLSALPGCLCPREETVAVLWRAQRRGKKEQRVHLCKTVLVPAPRKCTC